MDAFRKEVKEHEFRIDADITLRDIYNLTCFVTEEECSRLRSDD